MAHLAKTERYIESPGHYAERIGREYSNSKSVSHKKEFGQYLTPYPVAAFMARLYEPCGKAVISILDPGAGTGMLSCALLEHLASKVKKVILTVYELDAELLPLLNRALQYGKEWLLEQGTELEYDICNTDFVLENAGVLGDNEPDLFTAKKARKYDVVICNPPYFKLNKQDPRAIAGAYVVHGQPNIYAIFMAISAYLVKNDGDLIFITPRSFTAGPYFKLFRKRFFTIMRPELIHIFGSRKDAFNKDEVLQENVILKAKRNDHWHNDTVTYHTTISHSNGITDLNQARERVEPISNILDMKSEHKLLFIPTTVEEEEIISLIRSWKGSLHSYGLEISTGPVVPFRATKYLTNENSVPLLWMQNVSPMKVTFPVSLRKPQYIIDCSESSYLLIPNKNYVLIRRFSAKEEKRRLVAAPYIAGRFKSNDVVGIENHLNYIHKPQGEMTVEEAYGLAAVINSRLFDKYFRTYNGNTQVSATELRSTPLPPMATIVEIGMKVTGLSLTIEDLDNYVSNLLERKWEN